MFTAVTDRAFDERDVRLARARVLTERYYAEETRWNLASGQCAMCGEHRHLVKANNGDGVCCCCLDDITGDSVRHSYEHRCSTFEGTFGRLRVEADRLSANGSRSW